MWTTHLLGGLLPRPFPDGLFVPFLVGQFEFVVVITYPPNHLAFRHPL